MNSLALFFDAAPSIGVIGAGVAAAFLLVLLGVAFVAYKALRKTVKMAVRMTVVGIILLIGVVGSLSLWYFSTDGTPKLKPPVQKKR